MKYVSSIFNYMVDDPEQIILFNSYSQKIVCSKKKDAIRILLSGEQYEDEELKKSMIADGFLVPEKEDELAKGKLKYYDRIFGRMLSLTLLATEQCNFRCKYCYESFTKGKMQDEVVDGVIRYLQKNISSYSGLEVSWFGGEPLLAPDIIEKFSKAAIRICASAQKPYRAGMTTNGYLLTPDRIERLLQYKVFDYQVTLDCIKEEHDKYRLLSNGEPTFEVIMNNLRRISKEVKSRHLKISIRANITKASYEHMDEFMDLMYKEFSQDKRFHVFFRPAGDWGGERVQAIKADLFEKKAPIFERLLKYNRETELSIQTYSELLRTGVCYAAVRNNYIIGTDGIIYKCTLHFDKEFNQVGKVLKNGKFELNAGKLARWITPSTMPEQCLTCFMGLACPGGQCAAQRMQKKTMREINCGHEVNDIDNLLRLICRYENRGYLEY